MYTSPLVVEGVFYALSRSWFPIERLIPPRQPTRAWRRFGKGNHPAGLNFGDCLAYALAETTGEPLLFKGDDFTQTEIAAATSPTPGLVRSCSRSP